MKTECLNKEPAERPGRLIQEVAELYGVDPWTVRLWANRFGMLERFIDTDGNLMFSPRAVEQIGMICRLAKNRMRLDDVRKYLESDSGDK